MFNSYFLGLEKSWIFEEENEVAGACVVVEGSPWTVITDEEEKDWACGICHFSFGCCFVIWCVKKQFPQNTSVAIGNTAGSTLNWNLTGWIAEMLEKFVAFPVEVVWLRLKRVALVRPNWVLTPRRSVLMIVAFEV